MTKIKNYTSEVPASRSMALIEECLVAAGATNISKGYEDGICNAITFRMMVNLTPVFFKLPARVDACYKVLYDEYKRPTAETRKTVTAQANRTAWKIVYDWVVVQLAMIQLHQAEAIEVFLPYVWDPVTEQTLFERIKRNNFKELGYKPEK